MSKPILLDAFYTQVSDLLGELARVFPYDLDFPAYRTQFHILKKTNPGLPLKQLGMYAPTIEPLIKSRDAEAFFTWDVPSGFESLVDKLHGYWDHMTPENRAIVWSYLHLLTQIASRYIA